MQLGSEYLVITCTGDWVVYVRVSFNGYVRTPSTIYYQIDYNRNPLSF